MPVGGVVASRPGADVEHADDRVVVDPHRHAGEAPQSRPLSDDAGVVLSVAGDRRAALPGDEGALAADSGEGSRLRGPLGCLGAGPALANQFGTSVRSGSPSEA